MNIIHELIYNFFCANMGKTAGIIGVSLLINVFRINIISFITANILESIHSRTLTKTQTFFRAFIAISILYIVLIFVLRQLQYALLVKIRQWIKRDLMALILQANKTNYSDVNFTALTPSLVRIGNNIYYEVNSLISNFLPNASVICVVFAFLLYYVPPVALTFLAGNVLALTYIALTSAHVIRLNRDYEETIVENEASIIEILGNMDKIIFRATGDAELATFTDKINTTISTGLAYYNTTTYHAIVLNSIIFATIFACISLLIGQFSNKRITATLFITFFTVLLLYRDIALHFINIIPEIIDFNGRTATMIASLKELGPLASHSPSASLPSSPSHTPSTSLPVSTSLPFTHVEFRHIHYKYRSASHPTFADFNLSLPLDGIIGVTGISGQGKSTLFKLLLRIYEPQKGSITIDGLPLSDIDVDVLRREIVYVSQNSKLFDRPLFDNIFYGCPENATCASHLSHLMTTHSSLRKLYRNVSFHSRAGAGGERISGGQRQIVNVLNGLILPSPIVILDEPTNGLDHTLKGELIDIIKYFKEHKRAIIIISHDKDMIPLFDREVTI